MTREEFDTRVAMEMLEGKSLNEICLDISKECRKKYINNLIEEMKEKIISQVLKGGDKFIFEFDYCGDFNYIIFNKVSNNDYLIIKEYFFNNGFICKHTHNKNKIEIIISCK